jgi:hypothetical protein
MSLDIKDIPKKAADILKGLKKYMVFACVILVLAAYGFLVFRINGYVSHEPDNEVVSERLDNLRRPKIDQSTIDKIQQLQDTNIQVKSLFDQARDNPFQY